MTPEEFQAATRELATREQLASWRFQMLEASTNTTKTIQKMTTLTLTESESSVLLDVLNHERKQIHQRWDASPWYRKDVEEFITCQQRLEVAKVLNEQLKKTPASLTLNEQQDYFLRGAVMGIRQCHPRSRRRLRGRTCALKFGYESSRRIT
jgi:hypothetical protein